MKLSYFVLLLFHLCFVIANEFDAPSVTGRHLLAHSRGHSSNTDEKKSSPPKYAHTGLSNKQALPVYIRPSRSATHKHKTRSYADLLTAKWNKKSQPSNKKTSALKKKRDIEKSKNTSAKTSVVVSKVRELVPVNQVELDRCRTLLHIETSTPSPAVIQNEQKKSTSKDVKSKTNEEPKQKVKEEPKSKSKEELKQKSKEEPKQKGKEEIKLKTKEEIPEIDKSDVKSKKITVDSNEKKSNEATKKEKSTKGKVESTVVTEETPLEDEESSSSNDSVVDRAFHFVKNMFQLSDDSLDMDLPLKESVNDPTQEQPYQSRKLLSIENLDVNEQDNFFSMARAMSNRRLLAVKSSKSSTSDTKSKASKPKKNKSVTTSTDGSNKPKVGWAYRYRISRYLAAQKLEQSNKRTKSSGNKNPVKNNEKKEKTSNDRKIAKRKLLQYDQSRDRISNQDLIDSVTITQPFRPKRLHKEKPADARPPSTADDRAHVSPRLKNSDPILIVPSHERHSAEVHRKSSMKKMENSIDREQEKRSNRKMKQIKPEMETAEQSELSRIGSEGRRVGWQYRYRVRLKLDHLKREHEGKGIPFDLKTLTQFESSKQRTVPKNRNRTQNKHSSTKREQYEDTKKMFNESEEAPSLLRSFISRALRSTCLFPFTTEFSFCHENFPEESNGDRIIVGKLRKVKESRAKQFIRYRVNKLGAADKATERRVDEMMRILYAKPSLPPVENPPNRTLNGRKTKTIGQIIQERPDVFLVSKRNELRTKEDLREEENEIRREEMKERQRRI